MPVYNYVAKDSAGNRKVGTVDARSTSSAVNLLKEQNLFVVSLDEKKEGIVEFFSSFRGVPDTEIVTFTRQLATMISAGLPLSRGLEVLSAQTQNKGMKKILNDVLRDVQGGSSLSMAFSRFPKAFSPTYVSLVKAGEASGRLEEILSRLADNLEAGRDLKSKFKGAMIYPSIVFLAMIGVFVLMMVLVVPKLAQMYESMNVELPALTKMMIGFSNFMVDYKILILLALVGAFFSVRSFLATPVGKEYFSKVVFSLPVFGKILRQKEITEFSRTLSLLIASGIPIVEALNIVSQVVTNTSFRRGALNAAMEVEKGSSLSDYLKMDSAFPPILGQMCAVGEETGQLDEVLSRISVFFAGETEHSVRGLSAALEPIILVILGSMVGLLIISIITPIYKITSSL